MTSTAAALPPIDLSQPTSLGAVHMSMAHWRVIATYFFFASRRPYGEPKPVTAVKSVAFVAWTPLSMIVVPALPGAVVAVQVVVQAMLAARG